MKSSRVINLLFHPIFWGLFVFVVVFVRKPGIPEHVLTSTQLLIGLVPYVGLFYIHLFFLFRLSRKKTTIYILSVIALLLITTLLSASIVYYYRYLSEPFYTIAIRRIFPGIFFLVASASLAIFKKNLALEKIREEKENEHLRSELSFLRSQVNPHFMLNVLNSMVSLARKKSDQLEPLLLELAGLMNYMLYDADNEKVSLKEEIEYLQSYIQLQMLRFGDDVRVNFVTPAKSENYYLEPMLLIPLIENAFKHGIGLIEEPEIDIQIHILEETKLYMHVKNKFNDRTHDDKDRHSGIGLQNLKKRLALVYPGNFQLDTEKNGHWFITSLNLPLQ